MEVNKRGIEDVGKFVYLGATVSKEGRGIDDIDNRVVKARVSSKNRSNTNNNFPIMPRSQIKRYDFKETMIVSIDNYLKFLQAIQQQENPIWKEFYNALWSKTRNACSQRQGK